MTNLSQTFIHSYVLSKVLLIQIKYFLKSTVPWPWLVWLSWLEPYPIDKRVQFLVRVHMGSNQSNISSHSLSISSGVN